jgi:hypothetical protein
MSRGERIRKIIERSIAMLSMFRKRTGTPSSATALEYCLWAGVFLSAFVAAAMIAVTRFATLQAAAHAVVAHLHKRSWALPFNSPCRAVNAGAIDIDDRSSMQIGNYLK